jgi:hypothetical protein
MVSKGLQLQQQDIKPSSGHSQTRTEPYQHPGVLSGILDLPDAIKEIIPSQATKKKKKNIKHGS